MNIEEVLAQVRPKTATARVCLRGDLLAQHEELEAELAEARRQAGTENAYSDAPRIAALIRDLEAEIDAASVEFTFTAVGQRAWTNLITEHQPSEDDSENGWAFDPRTFPLAAVAASATEPKMTADQVERLYSTVNVGQWSLIFGACLRANTEGTSVPFSAAASAVLGGYETKSDSPTTTELHAVSSSAG